MAAGVGLPSLCASFQVGPANNSLAVTRNDCPRQARLQIFLAVIMMAGDQMREHYLRCFKEDLSLFVHILNLHIWQGAALRPLEAQADSE